MSGRGRAIAAGTLLVWCAACGGGPAPAPGPAPESAADPGADRLVPPGYGTLRQDAFTVALRVGQLQIKVTPLAEEVIRLAAPDTYERLRTLAESHLPRLRLSAQRVGLARDPLLFLVSFHTFAPQSEYTPTDLQLVSQGVLYRPIDLVAITPEFGAQLLRQEETQIAVYAFDPAIDLNLPFTVKYGAAESNAWEAILSLLESERARVRSRAKAETG